MDTILFLTFFCLLSAFITYGLGIFVFSKNQKSIVNLLFLALMLAATYWAIGEFLIWLGTGYESMEFWLKVSSFWPLVPVLTVHFMLAFTENSLSDKKNLKYLLLFLYLPAIGFAIIEIFTELILTINYEPGFGFIYTPSYGSFLYPLEAFFMLGLMVWAVVISLRSWIKPEYPNKRQSNLVSIGIVIVIIFGSLSGVFLPSYGIHTPNLVFIGIVSFSLIITYAILRYGLFILSPESATRNIMRTMPDGLIIADMNGIVKNANPASSLIFKRPEKELKGIALETLVPEPAYSHLKKTITENGAIIDNEAVLQGSDYTVVSIAGSVVKNPDDIPAGIVLIIRDITSRKMEERALKVANEKISLLIRLTRHDINNQVTAIQGYLALIEENGVSETVHHYLSSCMDLVTKISHQLQFSRDYELIGSHNPAWNSLKRMIYTAISELPENVTQIKSIVSDVCIYTDPLFEKVIYNILENALRHGEILKTIQISTRFLDDGDLLIIIMDDGVGVPLNHKELIFSQGFGKNTGLGLSISREVLSVTGISIIENGVPGEGARFEIRIPAISWRYPEKYSIK